MTKLNLKIKLIIYPILYWIINLLVFYYLLPQITSDGGYILIYLIIYPILFVLPYILLKSEIKNKILFILFGLIIPLLIFYGYLFFEFKETFNPQIG